MLLRKREAARRLHMRVSLASGKVARPQFRVNLSAQYTIEIEAHRSALSEALSPEVPLQSTRASAERLMPHFRSCAQLEQSDSFAERELYRLRAVAIDERNTDRFPHTLRPEKER